jgi:predicted porin
MIQFARFPFLPLSAAMAVSLVARQGAGAADIDTSLGGFVKLQYGLEDPSLRPLDGQGARLDGEIHASLSGQTDIGITYDARLQLLPAAKPRDNATYLQAGWAWGEFRLGDAGGAVRELALSAPTIGIGQIDGDLDRFGGPSALIAPYGLADDSSTRLTYLSPAILGYRLGLSYAPELAGGGIEPVPIRPVPGIDRHRNVVEVALSSSRDIGDVTVVSSAAYVGGDATAGSHLHDLAGGTVGARLIWNDLTIGGGYVFDGADTLPPDRRPGHVLLASIVGELNAGVTYEFGHWKLGASWAHDARKALRANDIWAAGAVYRIAAGVTVAADLLRYSTPHGAGSTESTALIAETAVHF